MWDFIKWFIVIDLLGWVIYPTAFSLFSVLKDKGFTVSKILGLLVWGYLYWVLNTFGLDAKSTISAVFIFILIAVSSFLINKKRLGEVISFIKTNQAILIFYEVVFLLAFAFWAFIRSLNPEIIGTEKPMELAFINAIYRSPSFPPNDPWLSGYAISYYYFGYLLVAMFMQICGTASGVAFNLAVALWFGLITVASAGLLFNMIRAKTSDQNQQKRRILFLLFLSLLAPLMILIVSNAEGFLEILHANGAFWDFVPDGKATSGFWQWLDIQELNQPPSQPFGWQPSRVGGTWWWRASRVLQDYDVMGNPREIIDEFPFFSFYLADLHPHVISIPFVLLVLSWAFSFIHSEMRIFNRISLKDPNVWISGFLCGSLIFINTWDFPIYAGLFIVLFSVRKFLTSGNPKIPIKETLFFAISLGITSILPFLPFILGLSSQAGGFLPSLVFRTRGIHFLVMFFPQIILVGWLLFDWSRISKLQMIFRFIFYMISGSLVLFGLSILYVYSYSGIPSLINALGSLAGLDTANFAANWQVDVQGLVGIYGSQDPLGLIAASIKRLLEDPTVILMLSVWIGLGLAYLYSIKSKKDAEEGIDLSMDKVMAVVMVMIGALLCLTPELFYLRDQFGWRMNTIFKFYYQAWILLSLVSSYFVITKLQEVKSKASKIAFTSITILVIAIGLAYPCFALADRLSALPNRSLSLDGNAYVANAYPEEYKAITFLQETPYGVITEAVGGSYSNYARISKLTGLPTVVGWPGHELQWRGGVQEIGSRESDINQLYTTPDWNIAQNVIAQYDIDYIYIGPLERSTYSINEEKFANNLALIYQRSDIKIYATNR